jgi:plasmid stabilization system protein ParE
LEPQSPRLTVVFAERAKRDIASIFKSIVHHNPVAAQRVEDAIRSTCLGLSLFPFASAETNERNVRRIPIVRYPYTVFFRITGQQSLVEIVRVIHASRVKLLRTLPE